MENGRAGVARSRKGDLGTLPRRVRSVLHAPPGRPETPQGALGVEPDEERGVVRARRGRGRFNRLGGNGGGDAAPAGRMENNRTGPQVEVRCRLAAVPRRLRSLLRTL